MSRPRQISDEQMLATARAVFLSQGPSATTATIAKRLGVSQAALFKRFHTKERLMRAALWPDPPARCFFCVAEGPRAVGIKDQLIEIATAMARFFDEMVPRVAVLRAAGLDETPEHEGMPAPLAVQSRLADFFRVAHQRGVLCVQDPVTLARVFAGGLVSRAFLNHLATRKAAFGMSPDDGPEQAARALVETLWTGIAANPTHEDRP